MPRLMIDSASSPPLAAAVAGVTSAGPAYRARITVSMNPMHVYDAICATVGAAIVSNSTIGRTGRSAVVASGRMVAAVGHGPKERPRGGFASGSMGRATKEELTYRRRGRACGWLASGNSARAWSAAIVRVGRAKSNGCRTPAW